MTVDANSLLAPYLPQSYRWALVIAVFALSLFTILNFRDFSKCLKVMARRQLPKAVLLGLFVGAVAASLKLFDLKDLLSELRVPAPFRSTIMAYSLAVLAVLSVITWLFLKRKTERAPFSNTFLKSGMGFDEVVIFILLLAALYNVFLLALPPTREALIGRLAALLVSKQYLRLDSELRSIRTMSEFSDIYHYYYGWYLRNNLHVGDPDSQFRQVPESSSLYFDAQKTRILHANSFFSIDRREHARRLGMILSDFEKSRLADSSLYFYAALLKNFPNFEEEHVEGLYRRFMARNGRHFSLADFGVRMQGRQGSFDIFRIADAVPTYFFFQTARVIAFDRSGRSPKRDSCLVEARRQLSLLGPAKICWHFRSSFGAEKLCRHLVGVVRFPSDPAKRDAASNAFLVPDESEFTVRIEAGDGKEILLMVRAVTGV